MCTYGAVRAANLAERSNGTCVHPSSLTRAGRAVEILLQMCVKNSPLGGAYWLAVEKLMAELYTPLSLWRGVGGEAGDAQLSLLQLWCRACEVEL